jgi:hypothetical protein
MQQVVSQGDTDLVDFGESEALQPYLNAVHVVARDAATATSGQTASRVRALGLTDVLDELGPQESLGLMFHAARLLAQADPAAAWLGLHDASSVLLGAGQMGPVALPAGGAAQWVVCMPAPQPSGRVLRVDPASRRVLLPNAAVDAAFAETWATAPALSALQGARQCVLSLPDAAGSDEVLAVDAAAWTAYGDAHGALLTGLIAGACQRLTEEAFSYAKQRQSGGKPISQYQAVALRLADLAMSQAALSLYLEATAASGTSHAPVSSVAYVTDAACAIARDAVQTAAGHGYVDGLPFMRSHEQVYVLCALLAAWGDAFVAPATHESA